MGARKLTAAIAVRSASTRLYAKPIQNLDVDRQKTILAYLVDCVRSTGCVDDIVLGIAEGQSNKVFEEAAADLRIKHIYGSEDDVLSRLIACGEATDATDVLRMSSESPFLYYEGLERGWGQYKNADHNAMFLDNIVDGCGFEILSLDALRRSHAQATKADHFEHCSMYIRENHEVFDAVQLSGPAELDRLDLRLTVDNPEDLVICRHIYQALKASAPRIPVTEIVTYLDANPHLIALTAPFTEAGYASMFVWGKGESS